MLILGRENRGLTLVEMVMTLAILGVLLALAVPSFVKYLPGIKLKGDVRDVASVMRLARMRAVAERAQYGVYFSVLAEPAQYTVFQDVNEDEDFQSGTDDVVFSRELNRRVVYRVVNFANDAAVFRADGTSNGGWISLGLSERADSLAVDILPSTGRVKVIR